MAVSFRPEMTISVLVSDWQAARKWYRETLGLQEGFVTEEGGWAEFSGPGQVTIGLNALNGEAHPGPGATAMVFGVDDIARARAELETRGVQFLGPTDELPGMVRLARFQDPDGNVMMLAESLMQP
jgi:predicted enzyme related to lactoylglutathione lyase